MSIEQAPTDAPLDPAAPTSPDTATVPVSTDAPTEAPIEDTVEADAPAPDETPSLAFGGVEITEVIIDDDLNDTFTEKGLDASAIANELYSGEEFGLSDETKEGLYAAFGKFAVDSYLRGLEAENKLKMSDYQNDIKSRTESADKAWTEALEIIGGEEQWDVIESWADQNFTDQEYAEYNEIMEGSNWTMQRLALQDLARRAGSSGDGESSLHPSQDKGSSITGQSLELVEMQGNDARGASDSTPLTSQQYNQMYMQTDDPAALAKLDQRRQAGISKGI